MLTPPRPLLRDPPPSTTPLGNSLRIQFLNDEIFSLQQDKLLLQTTVAMLECRLEEALTNVSEECKQRQHLVSAHEEQRRYWEERLHALDRQCDVLQRHWNDRKRSNGATVDVSGMDQGSGPQTDSATTGKWENNITEALTENLVEELTARLTKQITDDLNDKWQSKYDACSREVSRLSQQVQSLKEAVNDKTDSDSKRVDLQEIETQRLSTVFLSLLSSLTTIDEELLFPDKTTVTRGAVIIACEALLQAAATHCPSKGILFRGSLQSVINRHADVLRPSGDWEGKTIPLCPLRQLKRHAAGLRSDGDVQAAVIMVLAQLAKIEWEDDNVPASPSTPDNDDDEVAWEMERAIAALCICLQDERMKTNEIFIGKNGSDKNGIRHSAVTYQMFSTLSNIVIEQVAIVVAGNGNKDSDIQRAGVDQVQSIWTLALKTDCQPALSTELSTNSSVGISIVTASRALRTLLRSLCHRRHPKWISGESAVTSGLLYNGLWEKFEQLLTPSALDHLKSLRCRGTRQRLCNSVFRCIDRDGDGMLKGMEGASFCMMISAACRNTQVQAEMNQSAALITAQSASVNTTTDGSGAELGITRDGFIEYVVALDAIEGGMLLPRLLGAICDMGAPTKTDEPVKSSPVPFPATSPASDDYEGLRLKAVLQKTEKQLETHIETSREMENALLSFIDELAGCCECEGDTLIAILRRYDRNSSLPSRLRLIQSAMGEIISAILAKSKRNS